MRLTNEMRVAFAKRVMAAVKMKSKWNREKIEEEVGRRLNASLPQEVQDFAKKYPQHLSHVSTCIDKMAYRERDKVRKTTWWCYPRANHINGAKMEDIKIDDLLAEWVKYRAELEKRDEMYERILDQSRSVNTVEDLLVMFPKLAKHIPQPPKPAKKSLPVAQSGLMDELIKMGLETK